MAKKKPKKIKKFIQVKRNKKTSLPALEAKAANLLSRNLLVEAEKIYRKILVDSPDHLDAQYRLGFILLQNGQLEEAVQYLNQAQQQQPSDSRIQYAIGCAYNQLGLKQKAISSFHACLNILQQVQGDDQVSEAKDRLLKTATVLGELAYIYFRISQYDEAEEYALKSLAIDPGNVYAKFVQAKNLVRQKQYEMAVERLEGLLRLPGVESITKASIHNELGHVFDRLGKYENAVNSIEESNRLMRLSPEANTIDPQAIPLQVYAAKKYVQQKRSSWNDTADKLQFDDHAPPFFLIGFTRSGTTLIEQLLYQSFDMLVSDELPVISEMTHDLEAILKRKFTYPDHIDTLTPQEIMLLRAEYWARVEKSIPALTNHSGAFLDKQPLNLIYLPFIQKIFPDSRIIFALRDPRDVCISNYFQMFKLHETTIHFLSLDDTVSLYTEVMELWLELRESIQVSFIETRYEDLVSDKDETLASLSEYLQISSANTGQVQNEVFQNRYISTPSYQDVTQPIYERSRGRWLNYKGIFEKQFLRLENIVQSLGYPSLHG